jgi:hypothetical protein
MIHSKFRKERAMSQVRQISVKIKWSRAVEFGAWKTIELGAEAEITSETEDWRQRQRELSTHLVEQLKAIWRGQDPPKTKTPCQHPNWHYEDGPGGPKFCPDCQVMF